MTGVEALIHCLKHGTDASWNWDRIQATISSLELDSAGTAIPVATYGFTGLAIQQAVAAAIASGVNAIIFTAGTYVVDPQILGIVTDGYCVAIPSNFQVYGVPGAVIRQTGLGEAPEGESYSYAIFRCLDGTHDVKFQGLTFEGEKPNGAYTFNHQSACIDIWLTTSYDIWTIGCKFSNLWGFSIHDRGNNRRIHAIGNHTYQCANGINICSEETLQCFNVLVESEGLEASGGYSQLCHNILIDCEGVGISAGGDMGTPRYGTCVSHNRIIGCKAVNGQLGHGIVVSDNFVGGQIHDNYIRQCEGSGIVLVSPVEGNTIQYVSVKNNKIYSCGVTAGAFIGIQCLANQGWHTFEGNQCLDLGIAGYQMYYGLLLQASHDCRVQNNDFKGTFHDATYSNALRIVEKDNRYINGTQETSGSTWNDITYGWRA